MCGGECRDTYDHCQAFISTSEESCSDLFCTDCSFSGYCDASCGLLRPAPASPDARFQRHTVIEAFLETDAGPDDGATDVVHAFRPAERRAVDVAPVSTVRGLR